MPTKKSFLVEFVNRTGSVTVEENQTILDATLDAGIPIRFGCMYGDCTACASRLVTGKVTQVGATGLSKQQMDDGLLLLCVAVPLTDCTISVGVDDGFDDFLMLPQ